MSLAVDTLDELIQRELAHGSYLDTMPIGMALEEGFK